jgi:GT2 family glycosyltransferase
MDAGTAACLMVRKSALDRIGHFDPRYFMFGEDLDLCYRLKLGGWKVFYVPGASATHNVRPVSADRQRQIAYERHRAMWMYHFKHHSEDVSAFGNGLVWAQIWGRYAAVRVRDMIKRPGQQAT